MIAVTGASGHYGRLAVLNLIERGMPAGSIVALVRDPSKVSDLAKLGVDIRVADFDKPATLTVALQGVKKLLFVSSNEVGKRVAQHGNVVNAAREANLELLVYTSILRAGTSPLILAGEHKATEDLIRSAGIPYALLRNGWYIENYTDQLPSYLEHGAVLGCAGDGKISAATRADYAAAGAAVLMGKGKVNATYELGGDSFTLVQLAATVAELSGKPVKYQNITASALLTVLMKAGLPEPLATALADSEVGMSKGHLFTDSTPLVELLGRPATTAREVVAATQKG